MLEITKELETGIAEVDAQHRELVNRINSLINLGEEARDASVLQNTLNFLAEYAVMHFNTEEDLMSKCVYPACYLHEGQHKLFVQKFLEFKGRFETEGYSDALSNQLNEFLVRWVVNHIKLSDTAFGVFYLQNLEKN